MVEVIVIAEGQTEEQFIKRLIAPALRYLRIYIKPQLLNTSKDSKGGAISCDRLKFNARNTLRNKPEVFLSTFLDLYGLATDFPKFEEAKQIMDIYARTACLEEYLHGALIDQIGCQSDRFLPHIQPYEYEGLLFSDVEAMIGVEPSWIKSLSVLNKVRSEFETPEHTAFSTSKSYLVVGMIAQVIRLT